MRPWEDVSFWVFVLPIALLALSALNEMFLEHHLSWRRWFRALIGAAALADVAFIVLLAVTMSHTHGCPFNGCD